MILRFLFACAWYPFLPARGPWENTQVMSGLRAFDGFLFTPLVQWIIDGAAVSGGCFPSAHVSGTVGHTVGLAPTHRKLAGWFGLVAMGLSVSCVYTRYYLVADILDGLLLGITGGLLGYLLRRGGARPFRAFLRHRSGLFQPLPSLRHAVKTSNSSLTRKS